jgi:hypothetical protein
VRAPGPQVARQTFRPEPRSSAWMCGIAEPTMRDRNRRSSPLIDMQSVWRVGLDEALGGGAPSLHPRTGPERVVRLPMSERFLGCSVGCSDSQLGNVTQAPHSYGSGLDLRGSKWLSSAGVARFRTPRRTRTRTRHGHLARARLVTQGTTHHGASAMVGGELVRPGMVGLRYLGPSMSGLQVLKGAAIRNRTYGGSQ